jgi:membrane fusion protein (multidrug efflux system)
MTTPAQPSSDLRSKRRLALTAVAAAVVLAGVAYGAYYALVLSHFEHTDNAYVQAHVVQVTPQLGGTVVAVEADDTDFVKAGQPLVMLDPADARVALDQAEAQLAQTVREVRTLFANNAALKAQVALREAEQSRVKSELARAEDDVRRRAPLVTTGAVGKEEFDHANAQLAAARSAVAAANSAVLAAREQLASNQSLTDNTSVAEHPNVLRAAARVREAHLALERVALVSPVNGHVARRNVQVGQRVQAGTPLLSVIALDHVWVDANFKESQLKDLRIGQPVTMQADLYGKQVQYHGHVEGLGAGTGAAFALLPAQNATGNWIKVVQRVPVRVSLDPRELAAHPLRVGLSIEARVDVSDTSGKMLADVPRATSGAAPAASAAVDTAADRAVQDIIAANLGRRPAPGASGSVDGRTMAHAASSSPALARAH